MKILTSAISIIAVGFLSVSTASAQTISQCNDASVLNISSGTQSGTVLTMTTGCGRAGQICISDIGAEDAGTNRIYAAALTAQASGATARVRWDGAIRGCGVLDLPTVVDFRIDASAI